MEDNFKIDFIGIGVTKSGTSWLTHMLGQHPDICVSELKEVCYFNREMNLSAKYHYKKRQGPFINKDHTKPLTWYQKHFQHCKKGQIVGEYSPVYFYDKRAPLAIKETFPRVKLIVALRNPIDRAYSEYWMLRSSFRIEDRSFEEALQEKDVVYVEKGMYYKHLKVYLSLFDKNQIKVIFYDDIKKRPEAVIKDLYRFLEVDDSFIPLNIRDKANYAKASRIRVGVVMMNSIVKILVRVKMAFLVRFLRRLKINKLLLKIISTKLEYPPMRPETRAYLGDIFYNDIKNLETELGIDLSHWL